MATIHDLAKRLDVSVATVSRAINPDTRSKVSPDTLKKIDALIKKTFYVPNFSAKNLRKTSFKSIGVLIPHLSGILFSDYCTKVLSGVADALLDTGYTFKLLLVKPGEEKWERYDFKHGEGVDGVVTTHWRVFFSDKSALEKIGVPCAVLNEPENGVSAYFFSNDNEQGGALAAQFLHSKGHRDIAVMTGPQWSMDSRLRFRSFKEELKKHSLRLKEEWILTGDYQKGTAKNLVTGLLSGKQRPSAIFCLNDSMALGVMEKLKEMKLSCPEDISVVGYDDERVSGYSQPPLTTIRVPLYELAREATKKLLDYLSHKGKKGVFEGKFLFPVTLVERDSVREL